MLHQPMPKNVHLNGQQLYHAQLALQCQQPVSDIKLHSEISCSGLSWPYVSLLDMFCSQARCQLVGNKIGRRVGRFLVVHRTEPCHIACAVLQALLLSHFMTLRLCMLWS